MRHTHEHTHTQTRRHTTLPDKAQLDMTSLGYRPTQRVVYIAASSVALKVLLFFLLLLKVFCVYVAFYDVSQGNRIHFTVVNDDADDVDSQSTTSLLTGEIWIIISSITPITFP